MEALKRAKFIEDAVYHIQQTIQSVATEQMTKFFSNRGDAAIYNDAVASLEKLHESLQTTLNSIDEFGDNALLAFEADLSEGIAEFNAETNPNNPKRPTL